MTATSTAASSLPPVRTSTHVPLSLMTSISEETIALWLKLGALEKLEQAVLDGYGDQLCGKTSRIPQVNKFLKQVPLFQNKIREIHLAVSQGKLRDVQHLIDRKKLAFCRDHNGASPLHKAVIFGHQDVIEYLVKRYPGSLHIRDHQGRTVLHYAAFLPDDGEIYQYLLANGADDRAMDVYGRQPSYYLDSQNESTLRQLRDGSNLNGLRKIKPRYYGQVSSGNPLPNSNSRTTFTKSQIRELIAEGNVSALEDLVLQGQGDRLLGETSSIPKVQSFLNIVPMYMERIYDVHRAVMRDQLEHVVILLENRKLTMARDQLGATPLHKAVLFGHYKIAHYISHQFPDILNAVDLEGRTALHYAAALKDNKNMYEILQEAGANKGIYDNKGKTADYYAQYPEHLNLEDVIKRCHKVNANYLANTASRIKGKSPVRQTPPPSNGNLSSPRSEDNNSSSKDTSQNNDSGNESELMSLLQKDKLSKRLDMSSANIRRWVNAKDMGKLTKAVMEGYGDKVVRVNIVEETEDKEQITGKITEMIERINAIHTAVSSDDLNELQNHLEERDFALAKDHMGNTPLHKSVLLRKTKIVQYLTEKFPETINAKNKNGLTALHYAAAMSRKDGLNLYKMLLQAGADPKIRDNHGRTPDYYKTHLITLPNTGTIRAKPMGSRHTESLNRYSRQGVLERMTAALQKGDVELLQDLVLEGHGKHLFGKASWNEDVKTFLKELPSYLSKIQSLHESTKAGDVEKVKEFVSSDEKLLRARDEMGALPIHIAAASESSDILEYLAKHYPSSLNVKDATGKTALHIASQKGNVALYKMLKQAGSDAKILDQKGKTADYYLQNAKQNGPRSDYESSKMSLHSGSESSYSSVNTKMHKRKLSKEKNKEKPKEKEEQNSEMNGTEETTADKDIDKQNDEVKEKNDLEEEVEKENKLEDVAIKDTTETGEDDLQNVAENNDNEEEHNEEHVENPVKHIADDTEITTEVDTYAVEHTTEINETENNKMNTEIMPESNEDEDADIDTNVDLKESSTVNDENSNHETTEETTESNTETDAKEAEKEENENNNESLDVNETEKNQVDSNNDNIQTTENKNETDGTNENLVEKNDYEGETANTENFHEESKTNDGNDANNTNDDSKNEVDEKKENDLEESQETDNQKESTENKHGALNDENEMHLTENNTEEKTHIETNTEGITVAEVGSGKKENSENEEIHKTENENENAVNNPAEDDSEGKEKNSEAEKNDTEENQEKSEEKDSDKVKGEENNDIENVTNESKVPTDTNVELKDSEVNSEVLQNKDSKDGEVDEKIDLSDKNESIEKHEQDTSNEKVNMVQETEQTNLEDTESPEKGSLNPSDSRVNAHDESHHQTRDHLDELIEHWIKEGDLLRLEHVVLAGQGDRLIERTSDDKQVQDFLDLVPIYMAKIRAVHEAVAKGQLREVRSVLTRKRFALSRDHVGASPLHLAVLHGHTDVSTYIISHFPETMDGPDNEGRTPLHYASALRDNGVLYKLLKTAGADENVEDKAGHSPKFYMNNSGQLTLEQLLQPYSSTE